MASLYAEGKRGFVFLLFLLSLIPVAAVCDVQFVSIGFLEGGLASELRGVSADGRVAVGQAADEDGVDYLVFWTAETGLVNLEVLEGFVFSRGRACGIDSEENLYIAGYGEYIATGTNRAFLWIGDLEGNEKQTIVLPTFGGQESIARDLRVMANDDVRVVGYATNSTGKKQAFRWRLSDGDMLNLDEWTPADDANKGSDAWGISKSGGKISGFAQDPAHWAFHFTTANKQGMWNFANGRGRGISADGNWVVGGYAGPNSDQAFRWNWNAGAGSPVQELGEGEAFACSEDGSIVVGKGPQGAMIWDGEGGWRSLQNELEEVYGLELADWKLEVAYDISDDGKTIVGMGYHYEVPEGWVVRFVETKGFFIRGDVNQDSTLNVADVISLLEYLFGGGKQPFCLDSADANDDGKLDLADAIRTLGYLFAGGATLPDPFGTCGPDPTEDELDCQSFTPCQ